LPPPISFSPPDQCAIEDFANLSDGGVHIDNYVTIAGNLTLSVDGLLGGLVEDLLHLEGYKESLC
jgi:hypothetical protein